MYPPCDPGLPLQLPLALLQEQQQLMAALRLHAAMPPEQFETRFHGPVARVAEYVNLLPGSASSAFAGAGGLLRGALETGFRAFRASDGRIFTGALGVEDRHRLEGRWRYLCFAAGLLYPLGGALSAMQVTDSSGASWAPELEAVTTWAKDRQAPALFVAWPGQESQPGPHVLTASLALALIGRQNIAWMIDGSPALVRALLTIVSGLPASGLLAAGLVAETWRAVEVRERSRSHLNYGKLTIGSNLAPYLLDAMLALAGRGWSVNKETLYRDRDGLYLEWPKAGRDIIGACRRQGLPGIPATEAALLDVMIGAQLVDPGVDGLGLHSRVFGDGVSRLVVMLAEPALLLRSIDADGAADAAAPTAEAAKPVPQDQLTQGPPAGQATVAQLHSVHGPAQPFPAPPAVSEVSGASPQGSRAGVLPPELRASLGAGDGELLAHLVDLWCRKKEEDAFSMSLCEHGAAFELKLLAQIAPDPTGFLSRLGALGLLYTAASTAGKMIYPVSSGQGRAPVPCFILAGHTVRRLGLQ